MSNPLRQVRLRVRANSEEKGERRKWRNPIGERKEKKKKKKDTLFEGGQTINQENRALELLLNLFAENHSGERSVFSISNVVETAYQHFNLQPGAWFRSTTIMMSIEKLNRLYPSP